MCVGSINQALLECQRVLPIDTFFVDLSSKKLTVNINGGDESVVEHVRQSVCKVLEIYDCQSNEITIVETLPASNDVVTAIKKTVRSRWFLAFVGIGTGVTLMILSLVMGTMPLVLMIPITAMSVLLTLAIGAEFYKGAAKDLFKTRVLTMDTLFAISTLTVISVSIATFVFPWLPMMLDAGLLIFGFRHLGLAIEGSIEQTMEVSARFKDRLPRKVHTVINESLVEALLISVEPGDVLRIEPGELIPVDGTCDVDDSEIIDTIVTGSTVPRHIVRGEQLLAGMYLAQGAQPIHIRVTARASQSYLMALDDNIERANTNKLYDLCLMTENRALQHNKLYMELKTDLSLKYTVLDHSGTPKTGIIEKSRLKYELIDPLTVNQLNPIYADILKITSKNGHTKNDEQGRFEAATNRILQYFIPTVFISALLSVVVISYFFSLALAIQCAVAVLVSACPCTLGFITPLAVKFGMNKATQYGVEFKSTKILQEAEQIDRVVFDLFGTLTIGVPTVSKYGVMPDSKLSTEDLLAYFAVLEKGSAHLMAKAICDFVCKEKKTVSPEMVVTCLDTSHHSGLTAVINGEKYTLGNQNMMTTVGIDIRDIQNRLQPEVGASVIYLARSNQLIGYMVLTDKLRDDACHVVKSLKLLGKEVFLCTGADGESAAYYASLLDISPDNIRANCVGAAAGQLSQSDDKRAYINQLKQGGHQVAMIGDAVNDTCAIAVSDFGIAIKSRASDEITRQQAGAVIQSGSLLPVLNAFAVSRQTVNHIKQNLEFSLVYNILAMLVASGLLLTIGVTLNPGVGVGLMILQSSLLLFNANRFRHQTLVDLPQLLDSEEYPTSSYRKAFAHMPALISRPKSSSTDCRGEGLDATPNNSARRQAGFTSVDRNAPFEGGSNPVLSPI